RSWPRAPSTPRSPASPFDRLRPAEYAANVPERTRMRGRAERGESGFTVVEALIALVIIGVALLLGMGLLLQQPRVLHRIDAQRQALRAIESTIESLRAGLLPLEDAEY